MRLTHVAPIKNRSNSVRGAAAAVIENLEQRQLLSAALTLVNPDVLPSNDRLIFNVIQNPDPNVPNVTHNINPLILENTGNAPLTLNNVTISGPWEFVNAPAGGYAGTQIPAGGSVTVTLQFTQSSLPPHSSNQTNDTTQPNGGASINGSLTITSNDLTTPTKTVTLAGYWQNQSADEEEPNLLTIANALAGYDTVIATPAQLTASNGVDLQNNGATPTIYGQEVVANSWVAANPSQPVTVQKLATFGLEGVSYNTFWYSTGTQDSHLLMTSVPNQGQTLLPTLANGQLMTASFTPGGPFGFREDNLYSDDAVNIANGDTTDDGHRFRFYPLVDENGNAVPNSWLVAVHTGSFIPDYQDAVFIVTNMQPGPAATTPPAPTNLTASNAVDPVLNWTGVTYTNLAGYNVYRATSAMGAFTKLTASPIAGTTFTDNASPPAGVTLFYRVTAVDSVSGNESAPATTTANTPAGPTAGSFTVSAFTDQALAINILSHVTDATGTPTASSLLITTTPGHGTATADTTNGIITYTSNAGFTGFDTIVYSISDSNGAGPSSGTITVNVFNPATTAPIVSNQSGTTLANTPVTLTPQALDVTGAVITPALVEIGITSSDFSGSPLPTTLTTTAGGTITLNSNNTVTYTPAANFVGNDSFLFKVKDSNGNLSNQATFAINVGVEISSLKGGNKSITYPDGGGTQVTVTLSKGIGDVFFAGTGSEATVKGKVTITGTNLKITNIAASGTTASSVLALKTPHNSGAITLNGITDAGSLGSISAVSTMLVGNGSTSTVTVGGVHTINLKSISDAQIHVGSAGPASVSLSTGAVVDSFFSSGVTITSLKAASWTNVSFPLDTESITAPAIKSLNVTGEFDANLSVTGAGNALGTAKIGGALSIGAWMITGNVSSITAGSVNPSWEITVGGALKSFNVKSGGLPAAVTAGSIGSLTVTGDLTDSITTTGVVKTIKAIGNISGATISAGGNVSSITAVSLINSLISVGANAGVTLGTATAADLGLSTLTSIKLSSTAATAFSNSSILAHLIKSAALGAVNTSNGGTPEGLAAVAYKSVSGNFGGTKLSLSGKNIANSAAVQAFLTAKGISSSIFGDFEIVFAT